MSSFARRGLRTTAAAAGIAAAGIGFAGQAAALPLINTALPGVGGVTGSTADPLDALGGLGGLPTAAPTSSLPALEGLGLPTVLDLEEVVAGVPVVDPLVGVVDDVAESVLPGTGVGGLDDVLNEVPALDGVVETVTPVLENVVDVVLPDDGVAGVPGTDVLDDVLGDGGLGSVTEDLPVVGDVVDQLEPVLGGVVDEVTETVDDATADVPVVGDVADDVTDVVDDVVDEVLPGGLPGTGGGAGDLPVDLPGLPGTGGGTGGLPVDLPVDLPGLPGTGGGLPGTGGGLPGTGGETGGLPVEDVISQIPVDLPGLGGDTPIFSEMVGVPGIPALGVDPIEDVVGTYEDPGLPDGAADRDLFDDLGPVDAQDDQPAGGGIGAAGQVLGLG